MTRKRFKHFQMHLVAALAVIAVVFVGALLIASSDASTTFISAEPDSGSLTSPAELLQDETASAGYAVRFSQDGVSQYNCIEMPSDCSYPDATNTGVQPGTTLTNSGSVTVTTPGAVIQNLNITNGNISVRANNVTIRNVRITTCDYYPIDYEGYTGLVVQDTEIAGTCADVTACMSFENYTAIRVHCHGAADGFKANSNVVIRDSYIHDLAVSDGSHNDGVQSTGGSDVTLEHNTFDVRTAGVCIQHGGDSGWQVQGNLFNCDGWMINGSGTTADSSYSGNRFTRFASYGTHSFDDPVNVTWSGNIYDDDGSDVPL
jgi:hypothetical protein